MAKLALTGGAYQARSLIASAQRSVNLYAEPLPEAQGEPSRFAHYPAPGLRRLSSIGAGPIRGVRQATTGGVYVVSGSEVYSVNTSNWAGTLLGTITAGLRTPVSMADNGLDMFVVDGTSNGWTINLAANTFTQWAGSVAHPMGAGTTAFHGLAGANLARSTQVWTAPADGTIASITVSAAAAATVNVEAALYNVDGTIVYGADGKTIAHGSTSSLAVGANTIALSPPAAVLNGDLYYVVINHDATVDWNYDASPTGFTFVMTLDEFPPAKIPAHTDGQDSIVSTFTVTESRGTFSGADRVDYLDTFFLFNKPNTPQLYWSLSLSTAFDEFAGDFGNKGVYSDLLVTQVVAKREIYLLGERTTEVWYDVGIQTTDASAAATQLQFQPVQGVFIDHGIVAKYSVANYDNGLFWLSRDRQGQGIVLEAADYKTKRVSTYAIEAEIAGYARIDDAVGYCYQLGGHAFYVLAFPHADRTWVYDITTGLWHEWVWIDSNGAEHRHRSNCHAAVSGLNVVGDWQNGNLYVLDNRVFTDNGQPIKRVRSFPHIVQDGRRVFYREFIADMDTGNVTDTPVVVPSPPATSGFTALPLPAGGVQGAAYAISADGTTAVGSVSAPGAPTTRVACYWTNATGPTIIGPSGSEAFGVSADGSVIVGYQSGLLWRWTAGGGLVTFGTGNDSTYGMSADASRIIGSTIVGGHEQACYWNAAGTRTNLGYLPGHDVSRAQGVSADGAFIVGFSYLAADQSNTERAWRWTAGGGMVSLGIAGTATGSRGFGVSDDGAVVVGGLLNASGGVGAFRWSSGGGMVAIPELIIATGVSGDGGTLIASSFLPDIDNSYFAYQDATGITVPTPVALDPANPGTIQGTYPDGVSADGMTMVGYSFGANPLPWIYAAAPPAPPVVAVAVSENLISLRWSDDRGHSWSNPVTQPFGAAGEYDRSLQWNRLGYARDRTWELSWSVPAPTALQGAWIAAVPGDGKGEK